MWKCTKKQSIEAVIVHRNTMSATATDPQARHPGVVTKRKAATGTGNKKVNGERLLPKKRPLDLEPETWRDPVSSYVSDTKAIIAATSPAATIEGSRAATSAIFSPHEYMNVRECQ